MHCVWKGWSFGFLIPWVLVPSPECLRRDVAGWRISGYLRVTELNNIKTGAKRTRHLVAPLQTQIPWTFLFV